MRRFFKTVSIVLLCGLLAAPAIEARGRNNTGGGNSAPAKIENNGSRGGQQGNPGRPGGQQGQQGNPGRPGGQQGQQGNPGRPGGQQGQQGNPGRPGGQQGQQGNPGRPGGQQGGSSRPNQNTTPQRPPGGQGNPGHGQGNPGGAPGQGYAPGHGPGGPGPGPGGPGPGPGHNHGYPPPGPPSRPLMPPPRPFSRPVPPPHFRPYAGVPVINTILGIALGTTINISINNLVNSGYHVTGYGNNAVYLNNVNQLNLFWPNATLYYNNGYLAGSEFVYSTPYYDMGRYNMAYNMLTSNYGLPVSTEALYGGGIQTTWFGYNGQYVRLQYMPETAMNGSMRYYTVLSFGN